NNMSDSFSGWATSVGTFPRRRQPRSSQNVPSFPPSCGD
ncbi:hypothetical protein LSAT2_005145, partial [Lamellibrachia satsuma]